jgi:transcriptional regulator with XRE-family HTH domain
MSAVLELTRESSLGYKARKLRLAGHITRQKLAHLSGVSVESIDLFEQSLPVPLDYRRRILQTLWAITKG